MTFSQRIGQASVRTAIQLDSMDDALRNKLWNCFYVVVIESAEGIDWRDGYSQNSNVVRIFFMKLWHNYFAQPVDNIPEPEDEVLSTVRRHFFKSYWAKAYDFIEFVAQNIDISLRQPFILLCNTVLQTEMSGFRFIDMVLAPVSDEIQLSAIDHALESTISKFAGAHTHLKTALSLLSNRENPDYRNSFKESISAVESIASVIAGKNKAELDDALKTLVNRNVDIQQALQQGFSKIYGYSSGPNGIRHAIIDESTVDFADAQYMLVACSAFVNYLIAKSVAH